VIRIFYYLQSLQIVKPGKLLV